VRQSSLAPWKPARSARPLGALAALFAFALLAPWACKRAPDGLEEQRAACKELIDKGQAKAGLTVEQCAIQLKAAADAHDPGKKAEESVQRLSALVLSAKGASDPMKQQELRDAVLAVERIGRPVVPALQSRLSGSGDPEVRAAAARSLARVCWSDCRDQKLDCVVPALIELLSAERSEEERADAAIRLGTCTGKEIGADQAAWRSYWSSRTAPR
jgi:hypothetical protein